MDLKTQAKIASLRADAYNKLAEAEELEKGACHGMGNMPEAIISAPEVSDDTKVESIVIRIPHAVKLASLEALNKVSTELVESGDEDSLKTAKEIDAIAEQIDKMAKTIESDSDEKYMKDHFKGGVIQSDSEEKFMKEFDKDVSDESKNGLPAKGNAEVPYQKI